MASIHVIKNSINVEGGEWQLCCTVLDKDTIQRVSFVIQEAPCSARLQIRIALSF